MVTQITFGSDGVQDPRSVLANSRYGVIVGRSAVYIVDAVTGILRRVDLDFDPEAAAITIAGTAAWVLGNGQFAVVTLATGVISGRVAIDAGRWITPVDSGRFAALGFDGLIRISNLDGTESCARSAPNPAAGVFAGTTLFVAVAGGVRSYRVFASRLVELDRLEVPGISDAAAIFWADDVLTIISENRQRQVTLDVSDPSAMVLLDDTFDVTAVWIAPGVRADTALFDVPFTYAGVADTEVGHVAVSTSGTIQIDTGSTLTLSAGADRTGGAPGIAPSFSAGAGNGIGPYTYTFAWQDGSPDDVMTDAGGVAIVHAFATRGYFPVQVTAVDSNGYSAVATVGVQVFTVMATATPLSGPSPLDVTFGVDVDGPATDLNFLWDFGDGGSAPERTPTHAYLLDGPYTATVTIGSDVLILDGPVVSTADITVRP